MNQSRRTAFTGELRRPAAGSAGHPAVLVVGGSEGGLPLTGLDGLLASHGYIVLGVAYFGLPGLPSKLANIPLEYFARALHWLAGQPGVNPVKIAVLGVSEAARPRSCSGCTTRAWCTRSSLRSRATPRSAPTPVAPAPPGHMGGKPLPSTRDFDNPSPADDPAAVIQDQRINGPVFLDCGEADQTWFSCVYAQAILSRLDKYHDRWTHVLYAYPGAGHLVGSLPPTSRRGRRGSARWCPATRPSRKLNRSCGSTCSAS